jgi:hypothetical protein
MKKIIFILAFVIIVHCIRLGGMIEDCMSQWVQINETLSNTELANNINSITKLPIDTVALKYFPLVVGNVYKYHYGSSVGYSYYYKVRIAKDTIINSKRYFIINQSFPAYIGVILRCDSTTGNIYSRKSNGYCSYSPFEELIDSLRARKGDSTLVCTPYIPKHYCVDTGYVTLFGIQVKRKIFTRNTSEVSTSITYGVNFGIIFSYYSDFWASASESLVGCYINGILYGDTTLTTIQNINGEIPSSFSLSQNYPNPFNPATNIKFAIPKNEFVKITVFDILGKEIVTLVNEQLQPGTYETNWNASNYPSGVYFYRLQADDFSETKRMTLIK